jgi:anti-sigma factor RsiW
VSCNSSEALFEGYLDGTLLPAQRARLLAHVNACGRCKGVLGELRVVDALLAGPPRVDLPPNFTFATMAEIGSLPRPHVSSAPVFAYLLSYLVAAWLLIGAGLLLAGTALRASGETALDLSAQLIRTAGVFAHAGERAAGDFGVLGTMVGAVLALDVAFALVLVFGVTVVRPRLAERLRS